MLNARSGVRLDEQNIRREKALQLRRQRAGHLGDVKKKFSAVKELLNENVNIEVLNREVENYEQAFCKFVDIHEQYLTFEDDEAIRNLQIESYENQRDLKYGLELTIQKFGKTRGEFASLETAPSVHSHSQKSRKSSRASTKMSAISGRLQMEEANLKMKELHQRQVIERELERTEIDYKRRLSEMEEVKRSEKAELQRRLEMLKAETELERAATRLRLEEECGDISDTAESVKEKPSSEASSGMLPLKSYLTATVHSDPSQVSESKFPVGNPSLAIPSRNMSPIPASEEPFLHAPVSGPDVPVRQSFPHVSATHPNVPVTDSFLRVPVSHPSFPIRNRFPHVSFGVPRVAKGSSIPPNMAGDLNHHSTYVPIDSLYNSGQNSFPSYPAMNRSVPASYYTQRIPVNMSSFPNGTSRDLHPNTKIGGQDPCISGKPLIDSLPQWRVEEPEVRSNNKDYPPQGEAAQSSDAWMMIADAIRQGPTLPKIDLMMFSGDPLEFSEFVTNFKDNIESQVRDDSQRLTRLLAQCSGKAKESIRSCVNLPVGTRYEAAWKTLKQNFGQPYMVAEAHIRRLTQMPLKRADASCLMEFSRCLVDAQRTLSNLGSCFANRLDNEDLMVSLMKKIPEDSIKRRWVDTAGDLIKRKGQVHFTDFSEFVQKAAERLNNRFALELKLSKERKIFEKVESRRVNTYVMQTKNQSFKGKNIYECPSCSGSHGVWRCPIFKSATLSERLKVVNQQRLCRRCLEKGHFAASCRKKFVCLKKGCGKEHHWLIHPEEMSQNDDVHGPRNDKNEKENVDTNVRAKNDLNPTNSRDAANNNATVATIGLKQPRICFKVVPVRIRSPNGEKEVTTYAFLDSGSDTTLCLSTLADELDLESTAVDYTMVTMNDRQVKQGHRVCLRISSLDGETDLELDNVLTTDRISVTKKHFATEEQLNKWPHLNGIHLPRIEDESVKILIGMDRPDVIENDIEKRKGKQGEPYAVRTPLGWTVCGPISENDGDSSDDTFVNFIQNEYVGVDEQLQFMYNIDFGGTLVDTTTALSIEDRKATRIMEESARLVDGHYQLRLPFRHAVPELPDNYEVAVKRLNLLKKRLAKDEQFREQYTTVMKRYEEEGASKAIADDDLRKLNPIWFLPHHAVYHPKKPNEPRIVFDCASECNGKSLNHELLQGPDNTSSLFGVILRFRVDDIAVAADIKRMFHQVFVAPEDRGALCYLWWPDGNINLQPRIYQMLVHIFGAKSSPSVAGYALRRTAEENKCDFPREVIDAVWRDFYVDDLLKSFPDVLRAIKCSKQLQNLLRKGGFQLTKWISNSREVVSAFPEDQRSPAVKDLDMSLDRLPMEKALGSYWDIEEDKFKMILSTKQYPLNRKGVLSSVASIYDPLGFSSPLILPGKEINQQLCKLKYSWDDELPVDLAQRWQEWRASLAAMDNYGILRCFKPAQFGNIVRIEIHHFADASENHGYGMVSYLRFVNDLGRVHCGFVMSKSRVKPLRAGMTIPKLELTAATLAVNMNEFIKKELFGRLCIDETYFWTDSYLVLRYIRNEKRRFVKFVANRVAIIREGSKPSQWNYVRSEENPADYASRGIRSTEEQKLKIWRQGPAFLWADKDEWPVQPEEISMELTESEFGVRKEEVAVNTTTIQDEFWSSLLKRYSTWERMFRIVAWLLTACGKFRSLGARHECRSMETDNLNYVTLLAQKRAKEIIVRHVQRQAFSEEIFDIESSSKSKKGNRLSKLKPFVHDRILRVGGRLKHSDLGFDAKHPMIMPGEHHVTKKIILHFHILHGHVGTHQTLAETRQRFWIVKGVASVRRVLRNCHECKRPSARHGEQIIAPLPPVRVSEDSDRVAFPFSAVGVDYFGPFYVTRGKSTRSAKATSSLNKRYGCIFTCLRYRAVHIEIANDLSTDCFINAVLRFVARRGPPSIVYSDNGTNFRGAELDILKAMKSWNQEQIRYDLQKKEVEWKFNPPCASHYGGVWERLIRSVRRILHAMIGEQLVNEETLTIARLRLSQVKLKT